MSEDVHTDHEVFHIEHEVVHEVIHTDHEVVHTHHEVLMDVTNSYEVVQGVSLTFLFC